MTSTLRVIKGDCGRLIGRIKGGMNTTLHAVADANGCPFSFFMTAGQVSDYTGAFSASALAAAPSAGYAYRVINQGAVYKRIRRNKRCGLIKGAGHGREPAAGALAGQNRKRTPVLIASR